MQGESRAQRGGGASDVANPWWIKSRIEQCVNGMGAGRTTTVKTYSDLDRSQTAWVEAISAVLDWSSGQSGRLSMQGNQLMFTSPGQKTELTALINQVGVAEADLNEVLQKTTAAQIAAQEKIKANLQAAEKLLRK